MQARNFAEQHGDIVSLMLIGGIPWPEALDDRPFPESVNSTLSYHPSGHKLLISIAPLNSARDGLAPLWSKSDNQPLPPDWKDQPFNSQVVKKAFFNFCRRVVDIAKPDYLAIGIEDNDLLSHSRVKWQQLKELHTQTYLELKKLYPSLPVFFTTDVSHYLERTTESKGSGQVKEVADLMRYSDVFAMSFYPHMSLSISEALQTGFLEFAKTFHKPIAVSESGMLSSNVALKSFGITLHGTQKDQTEFERSLLETAQSGGYEFVINFATIDFDVMVKKLPGKAAELASMWEFTGLQDSRGRPKPSLNIWDNWLRKTYTK